MVRVIAILLLGTLTACTALDERSFVGLKTTPADFSLGGVIALSKKCPTEMAATRAGVRGAGLFGVLASAGAQFAVNAVDEAIKDYVEGLSGFFMASAPVTSQQLSAAGCLIIAYGLKGDLLPNVPHTDGRLNADILRYLNLADYPAFYLESTVRFSGDVYVFSPNYLSYAASSARTRGSGKKHVSVALGFSTMALKQVTDPGSIATEENTVATAYHNLGRLEIGRNYAGKALKGTESMARLDPSELAGGNFVVTAVVTESEDPGVALRAAQSAFTSHKDALASELAKAIGSALGEAGGGQ